MLPIERIEQKLRLSTTALAKELGLNYSTVFKWHYPKIRHGRDGMIPHKYVKQLMAIAKKYKIELTAEDFFDGY